MPDADSMTAPVPNRRTSRWVESFRTFADFFALSALAVAQPWLDVTAKNSEILVVRGTTLTQGIALVALVMLVPPVVATLIEFAGTAWWPGARRWVHGTLSGLFFLILGAELAKHQLGVGPTLVVAAGIVVGVVGGVILGRFATVGAYLRVLALVLAIMVPVTFLFTSPAARVLSAAGDGVGGRAPATRPTRVVLVILDELPTMSLLDGAGHIDRGLYPNLAALAASATWYRNHTTVAGFTAGAVPSILSGQYPADQSKPAQQSTYPNNVFTVMAGLGTVNGREAVTRLCPESVCARSDTGFGDLVGASARLWRDFAGPSETVVSTVDLDQSRASVSAGRDFVSSLIRRSGTHLDAVHLELPHFPWERLPDLRRYDVPEEPPGESYGVTPIGPGAATGRLRHLLQVKAADTMVGRIMGRLRAIGAFDDALVVVTADHGASFVPGTSVRNPTPRNLAGVMWTPLIVKYPGQTVGAVDDRRSESIDVVPTIAEVIGTAPPPDADGVSLLGDAPDRPRRRLYPFIWFPGPDDVRPLAGQSYIEVGGASEFRDVLATQAAPAGGDPTLRPYRIGPFGGLVGRRVGDVAVRPGSCRASIHDSRRFRSVDPDARRPDWVWSRAEAAGGSGTSRWFAVSVNGTVAAVAATVPGRSPQEFSFLVPPTMVVAGHNDVRVDQIGGSYLAPTLTRCDGIRGTGRS